MREIVSPLSGIRSPFGQLTSPLAIYAVLGIKPQLVLDFDNEKYFTNSARSTFSDALTFARASGATYTDSTGTLQTVSAGVPRRGHHVWDGSAWVNEGLLHESEARTQLLHTTDAMVTQSHTVTAVPHTLHFTGTGTVTLSGASTAGPLVGTGTGEQNRVSLTFTPSAASLTLTVSGTVTDAQLEVGSTPSSYIPNLAGSGTVTRAAETLTIPSANLPWSSSAVSIQMDGRVTASDAAGDIVTTARWFSTSLRRLETYIRYNGAYTGNAASTVYNGASPYVSELSVGNGNISDGILAPFNIALRHTSLTLRGASGGTLFNTVGTPNAGVVDLSEADLNLGYDYMGTIKTFRVWAADLGDTGIEEASA